MLRWRNATTRSRWFGPQFLLVIVPVSVALELFHADPMSIFIPSALAIIQQNTWQAAWVPGLERYSMRRWAMPQS